MALADLPLPGIAPRGVIEVSDPLVQVAEPLEPVVGDAATETVVSEPSGDQSPTVPASPETTTESATVPVPEAPPAPAEPPPPSTETSQSTPADADVAQGGQPPVSTETDSVASGQVESAQTNADDATGGGGGGGGGGTLDPAPLSDGGTPAGGADSVLPQADGSGQVTDPTGLVAGATGGVSDSAGSLDGAGGGPLDPVAQAADAGGQPMIGSSEPMLESVSFEAPPGILQPPPSLDAGGLDTNMGLPDPGAQTLLDPAQGAAAQAEALTARTEAAVQPLVQALPPAEPPLPGGLDTNMGLPDPGAQNLVQAAGDATNVPVASDAAPPFSGAEESHGLGESIRSAMDAIANGLAATSSATARLAALVFLLGVMAARLSGTASTVAGYAFASAGVSMRSAWLTSWGSARCVVLNAPRAISASFRSPASVPGESFSASRPFTRPVGNGSGGVLGALVERGPLRPFDRPLNPRGILGGVENSRFGRFLRVLLLTAAGLLALAALPARALRRRGIRLPRTALRLTFAVVALSILLAVGVVLAFAP